MASLSPARRLRTKTSDLSDFFRGTNHGSHQPHQPAASDLPESSSATLQPPEPSSSSKSKKSKIPAFLGRKKKSTQSLGSTHSHASSSSTQDLSDPVPPVPGRSSKAEGHSGARRSSSGPSSSLPAVPSTLPPLNVSPPSLGSKFAAHFTHARPKPLNLSSPKSSIRRPSGSLHPPSPTPRAASFESTASSASRGRTPTPRQPIITVSVSPPESLDEYRDLFTLSDEPYSPTSSYRRKHHPGRADDSDADDRSSGFASSPSPPSSPRMQFPNPPADTREAARAEGEGVFRSGSMRRVGSIRSKAESGKARASPTTNYAQSGRDLSEVMGTGSMWTPAQKRRTLATMPYKPTEKAAVTVTPRLSAGSAPRPVVGRATAPPSTPLPSPPQQTRPLSSLPSRNRVPPTEDDVSPRPRAHTITSVSPSATPLPSQPTSTANKENWDAASPEQLREALAVQTARFDELARYLLVVAEKHVAEKAALEKRIDTLERETRKRDKEIQGLRWLVLNNPGASVPSGVGAALTGLETHSTSSLESGKGVMRSTSRASTASKAPSEYTESEPENTQGLEPEGKLKASPLTMQLAPTPGRTGLGLDLDAYRRSSIPSGPSSPVSASSSSSLSLPALSASNTASSGLSAILETPVSQDPVVAAAILAAEVQREKEERRASRALRRISGSSVASSSSAVATAAYASNLKRGRPPSIAQVLDLPPSPQDMPDQRRPHASP